MKVDKLPVYNVAERRYVSAVRDTFPTAETHRPETVFPDKRKPLSSSLRLRNAARAQSVSGSRVERSPALP